MWNRKARQAFFPRKSLHNESPTPYSNPAFALGQKPGKSSPAITRAIFPASAREGPRFHRLKRRALAQRMILRDLTVDSRRQRLSCGGVAQTWVNSALFCFSCPESGIERWAEDSLCCTLGAISTLDGRSAFPWMAIAPEIKLNAAPMAAAGKPNSAVAVSASTPLTASAIIAPSFARIDIKDLLSFKRLSAHEAMRTRQ